MFGFITKFVGGFVGKAVGPLFGKIMGTLGLGKIQLIVLAVLLTSIGGLTLGLKLTANKADRYQQQWAAEAQAHQVTKHQFNQYAEEASRLMAATKEAMASAAAARARSEAEVGRLSKLLRKHDFGHLARKKPGLIERRINKATEEAFDKISWNMYPKQVWPADPENTHEIDPDSAARILAIEHCASPEWLQYTALDWEYCMSWITSPDHLPPTTETRKPGRPTVHRPRRGARGLLRVDYSWSRGPHLFGPKKLRKPVPRFLRDRKLLA